MNRKPFDYMLITLKGMAMGAADVVPGVSGGTIAFIAGIYEELITSINNINLQALKTLRKEGIGAFWKAVNGNFLLALLSGIGISVFSLARFIRWLLENHPVLLWSFFFGLIVASVYFLARDVSRWYFPTVLALLIGCALAYYVTILPPFQQTGSYLFLFFAGALAICAMILPGISGAFILVLLGAYHTVLTAVSELNIKVIATVGCGAVVGLLSFSRLLKWMFAHYKNVTIALLTGFVVGSLNKIWPWKKVLSTYFDSSGETKPLVEQNVLPSAYDGNPQMMQAIFFMIIGFIVVFLLERLAVNLKKSH